jgi:hypothetical protein
MMKQLAVLFATAIVAIACVAAASTPVAQGTRQLCGTLSIGGPAIPVHCLWLTNHCTVDSGRIDRVVQRNQWSSMGVIDQLVVW